MSKHVDRDLLTRINDYSLTVSYAWSRMGITCKMFFMWYVERSMGRTIAFEELRPGCARARTHLIDT